MSIEEEIIAKQQHEVYKINILSPSNTEIWVSWDPAKTGLKIDLGKQPRNMVQNHVSRALSTQQYEILFPFMK